jgi:ABC-type transporter Mla MlaB component
MLKIQSIDETATELTVALIGTIQHEYLPALEDLVQRASRDRRRVSFDLSQVRLVDREAVAFFVTGGGRRARLSGCPAYLREWIASESRTGREL